MYELNVGAKTYKIKYAYVATSKSGLMPKLVKSGVEDSKNAEEFFQNIQGIMEIIPEMILVGLQRFHKDEFGYDYDTNDGKDEALAKVNDLVDDLFSDSEVNFFDVYNNLQSELFEDGFLKQMFLQLQEAMKEQESQSKKKPTKK